MTTGFKSLDKRTDGLHRGELIVVGARPAAGKSALMANMAVRAAMAADAYSVAMISADLTVEQMMMRMIALEAVGLEKLRTGRLEMHDWQRLNAAFDTLGNTSIVIGGASESMAEMQKELADIKHGKTGLDVVLVDDLQSLARSMGIKRSAKGTTSFMRGLHTIARDLDVAVIITSQLSAAVESRADKRPRMSDLYQPRTIEREADVIMLLYRDEMYHRRPEYEGLMEIIVAKRRRGDSGTATLLFWPKFNRLEEIPAGDGKTVDDIFESVFKARLQVMNDEKEQEVDMSNTEAEMRYVTRDFPNLVLPNRKPVCSIEIDVTALSEKEKYRGGGWEDLIRTITATWVKQNSFAGKGTIWAWGSPSVNFGHQSFSMFYAVFGMSASFRKYLGEKIRVLGKHVRPDSDYVTPSLEDGWNTMCHIEDGKAWEPLDPTLWEEIEN